MRRNADLLASGVIAIVLAVLCCVLGGATALRVVVALPLVFGLPGYGLLSALVGRAGVAPPARVTLAIGLSVAAAILAGLALDATSLGFGTSEWAVTLAAVTALACLAASVRRRREGSAVWAPRTGPRMPGRAIAALAAAVVLVAGALLFSADSAQDQDEAAHFTEMSIAQGRGERSDLTVTVVNRERTAHDYILRFFAAGSEIPGSVRTLHLKRGHRKRVEMHMPASARSVMLEARLYRSDISHMTYRRVFFRPPEDAPL